MKQFQHNKISKSMFELSDEEMYNLLLNGNVRSFPKGFFDGVDGKHRACRLVKYLISNILNWSIDDIINKYSKKTLTENKLKSILDIVFDGDEKEAIIEAFPELREQYNQIISTLKEDALKKDRIPTDKEIEKLFPKNIIEFYFQSLNNLGYILRNEYSKEELISILRQKNEKLKRIPNCLDMKIPQAIVFIREFDEFDNALKESGLI